MPKNIGRFLRVHHRLAGLKKVNLTDHSLIKDVDKDLRETGDLTFFSGIMRQAMSHHQAGRHSVALRLYRQILDVRPDHAEALNLGGVAACQTGYFGQGIAMLRKAVAARPDYAEAHVNLGNVFWMCEDPESAVTAYRRAIHINSSDAESHYNLGIALGQLDQLVEAANAYRSALSIDPNHERALNNLGNALRILGDINKAISAYERVIELRPDHADAHNNLGTLLSDIGQPGPAVDHLRHAIHLKPDDVDYHNNLGAALRATGNPMQALDSFEAAIALDPGNTQAICMKALVHESQGDRSSVRRLVDINRFMRLVTFETAPGPTALRSLNRALALSAGKHTSLTHDPRGKTTRGGRQTRDLLRRPEGPFEVLKGMIRDVVEKYVQRLPVDPAHPFLANPPKKYEIAGWAVFLEQGGHQLPHYHPNGWLSGVYYVKVPGSATGSADEHAGCIEFGRPPDDLQCRAQPEVKLIRPEEGLIVLFPSYFWHRTVPTESTDQRISIAFDVIRVDEGLAGQY